MLKRNQIIRWYEKYNKDPQNDNKLERKILDSIDSVSTFGDFKKLLTDPKEGILKWKGALRTIHYYDSLDKGKWMSLFNLAKSSMTDPKETVKKIVDFSRTKMKYKGRLGGISYPVASTIVYFFNKGQCPVIDWRAVFTLKKHGYTGQLESVHLYPDKKKRTHQLCLEDDGWDDYYKLCHDVVSALKIQRIQEDTPIRILDKALWWAATSS